MKTLKFTAFLLYRYYSTGGTKDIPYFSTLCALVMLFGLHLFQILALSNKMSILPFNSSNTRITNYIIIAVCTAPIFLLFSQLIKLKDLKKLNYPSETFRKGYILLIVYTIVSIALTILIIEINRK